MGLEGTEGRGHQGEAWRCEKFDGLLGVFTVITYADNYKKLSDNNLDILCFEGSDHAVSTALLCLPPFKGHPFDGMSVASWP
jgi:hypothetical protein